ncbi:MAG: hypothetical protein V2I36_20005, partial [Desulfopila sp.]|nr:hypothetical protein [Desulfopila sp.]
HACIHRIAHGRGSERNRLIWLYDIHLLWNAMDEEQRAAFIKKALAKKIGAVCADALRVCDELFGTVGEASAATDSSAEPQSPLTRLLQNKANEPTAPLVNAGKLRWAWADLMATPGLRARLQFAGELIRNQV